MAARYYTKTQGTQLNNHLPCHLSQPTHLGTQPKATLGMNRQLTIYNRNIQQTMVPVDRMVSEEQIFQLMDSFEPFEYPTCPVFRSSLLVFKLIRYFKKRANLIAQKPLCGQLSKKNLQKSNKFASKFSKKTGFFSLHQNAG